MSYTFHEQVPKAMIDLDATVCFVPQNNTSFVLETTKQHAGMPWGAYIGRSAQSTQTCKARWSGKPNATDAPGVCEIPNALLAYTDVAVLKGNSFAFTVT